MVVCVFFQKGNCRYGQNCRFEHVYGSKYNYNAVPNDTTQLQINQMQSDLQAALKGGQWLLSVFAPFKDGSNFLDIVDISFEEARLFLYEAKANNSVDEAIQYINSLVQKNKSIYERLCAKQLDQTTMNTLKSLMKGEKPSSSQFPSSFSATNVQDKSSSIFRSAVQQATFGPSANKSVFDSGMQNQNANQSIFANQDTASKSIFAQANQNLYGPSQPTGNIFATASQSIFNSPPNQQASPFSTPQTAVSSPNIFQTASQNVFEQSGNEVKHSFFANPTTNVEMGQANAVAKPGDPFKQTVVDYTIYSRLEDLSESDLAEFRNDNFRLGFVPEVPPPRELCL